MPSSSNIQAQDDIEKAPKVSANTNKNDPDTDSITAAGTIVDDNLPSRTSPPINRWRFFGICLLQICAGLSDSAAGALIPSMMSDYSSSFLVTSLIFVGQAVGFILAAAFVEPIRSALLRRNDSASFLVANLIVAAAYIPLVIPGCPFALVVIAFLLVGFGNSFNVSMGNTFCSTLKNSTNLLGIMHSAFSLGGTIGPLIATSMVDLGNLPWGRFYYITLAMAVANACLVGWSFRGYQAGDPPSSQAVEDEKETPKKRHWQTTFASLNWPVVIISALFIFAYQGAEVTISGWVIKFLQEPDDKERFTNGVTPTSAGYVTVGYWAGITLGRFFLSGLGTNFPLGRETGYVYFLVTLAGLFQLVVWLAPNLITNAVAVAFVGLLIGPAYPCAMTVFMRMMGNNPDTRVSSVSTISAFGMSGGAIAPFFTGVFADWAGGKLWVMHPITIVLLVAMLVFWFVFPFAAGRKGRGL
ncbi:major facilitator superfamily transporter [Podospora australis]|uniref:Major facilitator superfamily transporter n=1 Tax=Podospora australis TaxID=1536484 RepID=A0AAN6WX60_9PEZI|nr:major facilitator superfamily transporter [Podospora australis]